MTDQHEIPSTGPTPRPEDSSKYDLWFDGLLDEGEARREHGRVSSDALERARFEADLAIEASLRRSFTARSAARPTPRLPPLSNPYPRRSAPWARRGAAAGLVILGGAALALVWQGREGTQADPPLAKSTSTPSAETVPVRHVAQYSLGDVFLDALALDFQPLLGCQAKDPWDAELFAQLASAPCNREEGVVVLGEWVDPRLDVANMLMLRRGENPIMLVVPRCEQETELCVPKDSGLYVHRGIRDGRSIYEISPVPGSEVLNCVEARDVVTQQQF